MFKSIVTFYTYPLHHSAWKTYPWTNHHGSSPGLNPQYFAHVTIAIFTIALVLTSLVLTGLLLIQHARQLFDQKTSLRAFKTIVLRKYLISLGIVFTLQFLYVLWFGSTVNHHPYLVLLLLISGILWLSLPNHDEQTTHASIKLLTLVRLIAKSSCLVSLTGLLIISTNKTILVTIVFLIILIGCVSMLGGATSLDE